MACDGPSKDYAYKVGEEAYEDVLLLLKEKYAVSIDEETLDFYKRQPGNGDKYVKTAMDNLKLAVQEMVWSDHAASF